MKTFDTILFIIIMIAIAYTIFMYSEASQFNENFLGNCNSCNQFYEYTQAPIKKNREYSDNFLKHAILSPRNNITVLSPTPPIPKTNCHKIKCPQSLKNYNITCWKCDGYGW